MKMLLGLAKPTEGRACILGSDTNTAAGRNILRKVGCVIENPGFYANLTGTENLTIFARLKALDDTAVQKRWHWSTCRTTTKTLFKIFVGNEAAVGNRQCRHA